MYKDFCTAGHSGSWRCLRLDARSVSLMRPASSETTRFPPSPSLVMHIHLIRHKGQTHRSSALTGSESEQKARVRASQRQREIERQKLHVSILGWPLQMLFSGRSQRIQKTKECMWGECVRRFSSDEGKSVSSCAGILPRMSEKKATAYHQWTAYYSSLILHH